MSVLATDEIFTEGIVVYIQSSQFFLVFRSLRVSDREELHEVVSRVCEPWHGHFDMLEVFDGLFGVALVYNVTIAHKDESVEEVEGLR